jgi:hypothetical protein
MLQTQDHKKEDSTVTEFRIQQFLEAARAYLLGSGSAHTALGCGAPAGCSSL